MNNIVDALDFRWCVYSDDLHWKAQGLSTHSIVFQDKILKRGLLIREGIKEKSKSTITEGSRWELGAAIGKS